MRELSPNGLARRVGTINGKIRPPDEVNKNVTIYRWVTQRGVAIQIHLQGGEVETYFINGKRPKRELFDRNKTGKR